MTRRLLGLGAVASIAVLMLTLTSPALAESGLAGACRTVAGSTTGTKDHVTRDDICRSVSLASGRFKNVLSNPSDKNGSHAGLHPELGRILLDYVQEDALADGDGRFGDTNPYVLGGAGIPRFERGDCDDTRASTHSGHIRSRRTPCGSSGVQYGCDWEGVWDERHPPAERCGEGVDADCDGPDCRPSCGDGSCNGSETCYHESYGGGWTDRGLCPPTCDGVYRERGGGETCASCSRDCGTCPVCGNGTCGRLKGGALQNLRPGLRRLRLRHAICNTEVNENCGTCTQDCGQCPRLRLPSSRRWTAAAEARRSRALRPQSDPRRLLPIRRASLPWRDGYRIVGTSALCHRRARGGRTGAFGGGLVQATRCHGSEGRISSRGRGVSMRAGFPTGYCFRSRVRSRAVAGLDLIECRYLPGQRTPRHVHSHASFCLVLDGTFLHAPPGEEFLCGPLSLLFYRPGEPHAERFHDEGARCLILELSPSWLERIPRSVSLDGLSGLMAPGRASNLACRLYREFLSVDPFAPLAIEGLALAMTAEALRAASPRATGACRRSMERARELVRASIPGRPISLGQVAAAVGLHPVTVAQQFRRTYHCSVGEYARQLRLQHACRRLTGTRAPLAEIALEAGFYDQSHMTREFRRALGITPARYRLDSSQAPSRIQDGGPPRA